VNNNALLIMSVHCSVTGAVEMFCNLHLLHQFNMSIYLPIHTNKSDSMQ